MVTPSSLSTRFFASAALAFTITLALASGCDVPPEEQAVSDTVSTEQAQTLPSCSTTCSRTASCSAGCSVKDSQGAVGTTCDVYMNGLCGGRDELDPNVGNRPQSPPSGGGGALYEPFWCAGPGPYQVVFWEHSDFRGNCVTMPHKNTTRLTSDVDAPWIQDAGASLFVNDSLSSLMVGSRVSLEIFDHAGFGRSFGTYGPGSRIPYVGGTANDKVSSFKIRIVR